MPTYVVLYKFTDQGIKDIKNAPQRIQQLVKATEAAGGTVIGSWLTMGEYDLVVVAEGTDDERALAFLLAQGAGGYVRSTTLKAFTKEQFADIVSSMPQLG